MSYARAERRAARARARVAGWIRVGLRSGAGRTALSTLRLFVGRREACIENAPCAWPCATQFAVYFRIPKERPARCVACTRAEHSRAVRTRVHNDRITIRRVTLTRAVAGIRVYGRPARPGPCVFYVFTPGDRDRYRVRARGWRQARTRRRDTRPCDAVPKRRGFDAATPAHPPPRVMAGFF